MTPSTIELPVTPADRRIAVLAGAAVGLAVAEAAIPLPIPGVKPGLANIVTLLVLYRHGWSAAAWVVGLRVVAGALLLGTFLTPTFAMSLAGGLASLALLAVLIRLPRRWFGPVGLSVLAALAHMSAQLLLVDAWLLPGASLAGLLPLFLSVAWVTGVVNGLVAAGLMEYAEATNKPSEAGMAQDTTGVNP
jgi:heptaprenyl diphosphate synthase